MFCLAKNSIRFLNAKVFAKQNFSIDGRYL